MTQVDIEELEQASVRIVQWFKEHCNQHMSIIIDVNGIRVLSEECGIPITPKN